VFLEVWSQELLVGKQLGSVETVSITHRRDAESAEEMYFSLPVSPGIEKLKNLGGLCVLAVS